MLLKVDIPMAPGLGLYLSELFFEGYNSKQHRAIQHSLVKQQQSAGSAESSRKKQKTDESVVAPTMTAVDNVGIFSCFKYFNSATSSVQYLLFLCRRRLVAE